MALPYTLGVTGPRERQLVLILADISGYTRFMIANQTAALHGQLCITALIETLLREVDIPLELQEIEGDALFLYAAHPGDEGGWQDVLAQVRTKLPRFFEVFFQGLIPAAEATPCGCAVCRNLSDLKLKVIVHVGRAVFHTIAGRPQISGTDVILAHRLLKNTQPDREYLLMTEAAHRELGSEMGGEWEGGGERYDGFGTVRTFVQRLDALVERERSSFYALPPAEFRARVRGYARWTVGGIMRAWRAQTRNPVLPVVAWPRRTAFALWTALASPFALAYIALVRPRQMRARRAKRRAQRAREERRE